MATPAYTAAVSEFPPRARTLPSARSASRRKASRSLAVTYLRSPSTVYSPIPVDRTATEAVVPGAGAARLWQGFGDDALLLAVGLPDWRQALCSCGAVPIATSPLGPDAGGKGVDGGARIRIWIVATAIARAATAPTADEQGATEEVRPNPETIIAVLVALGQSADQGCGFREERELNRSGPGRGGFATFGHGFTGSETRGRSACQSECLRNPGFDGSWRESRRRAGRLRALARYTIIYSVTGLLLGCLPRVRRPALTEVGVNSRSCLLEGCYCSVQPAGMAANGVDPSVVPSFPAASCMATNT